MTTNTLTFGPDLLMGAKCQTFSQEGIISFAFPSVPQGGPRSQMNFFKDYAAKCVSILKLMKHDVKLDTIPMATTNLDLPH
jgi:hypothetical protein